MSEMEKTRNNIRRGGRILYRVLTVARTLLIIALIVILVGLILMLIFPEHTASLELVTQSSFLADLLEPIRELGLTDTAQTRIEAAIGVVVTGLSFFAAYKVIMIGRELMLHLAEGERPFDVAAAKRLRKNSWFLLLFIGYNPVLGVISFALTLLFSYIMEYGGYIQEQADMTNRIQEEMILSFAEITENKSGQTGQHIKRVSEYSRILAEQLGLTPERVEFIRIASTMHDVGKLLIPTEILEKPGRLTDEEFATIKTHTTMGGQLLENVEGEEMHLSRTIALQHHERFDGNGYPGRKLGDDISLEGRIVAVADVYDALTSARSYKEAWDDEEACREILRCRGTQFDPQVVDAFIAAHDRILAVKEKFHDAERAAKADKTE